MARPRQYDDDEVRAGLVATFLERGYADASIVDLEQGSGLNRRQLYNAYGDKKAVFVQALNDFTVVAGERFLDRLEHGTGGLADIEAALTDLIDAAETPEGRLGCLICNSARETIATDDAVRPVVDGYFRRIEGAYAAAVRRAVQRGELPPDSDVTRRARHHLGVHVGLCVLGRAGEDLDVLRDIAAASQVAPG